MIQFETLSRECVNEIANQYDTPLYLIDEIGLLNRFKEFQCLSQALYSQSKIAVSYKTNPLLKLLSRLHQCGAYAEVVSGVEYQMAKRLNVPENQIIFNGPLKTDAELYDALSAGAIINCDHVEEVRRIEKIAESLNQSADIGLRVCFDTLGKQWHRFGFFMDDSEQGVYALIAYIRQSPMLNLTGLHAHIGTNIRTVQSFGSMAEQLALLAETILQRYQIKLAWIDVGGGLAGISPRIDEAPIFCHPLPSLSAYLSAVITPLQAYLNATNAKLIFEPGRTLFEPFGGLLTRVVASRPVVEAGARGLILDAGINALPSAQVYNHPLKHWCKTEPASKTYLFGPTCNQADQLYQPLALPMLERGDLLLFYGVGSYSMSFSYNFIRHRPGVIAIGEGKTSTWIRQRETIDFLAQLEEGPSYAFQLEA